MVHKDDADDGDDGSGPELDLLIVLRLSNALMGTNKERQEIEALADGLADAVQAAGLGEYDGEELGGGECTLYFCGPDPDRLLLLLRPLLKQSTFGRGAEYVRMVADAQGKLEPRRQKL